ncbi:MAG: glutamine-hydrolyzing carbamoyl-phosphate synthase small subunit [Actinobacteria bacterium]|nr:glutamine-hydrolyzing carbamoyl-phosphate synthase small subunit [Actinomycetota bacterium]
MSLSPVQERVKYREGALVLGDGAVFEGDLLIHEDFDFRDSATGEVVFNTSLSGYQEIITDPSYAGQIVTFTYPHIGNYGINLEDSESSGPKCKGVIARDISTFYSNWRANQGLVSFLSAHGVSMLTNVDTRALTKHIRSYGALPGAIGTSSVSELKAMALRDNGTLGKDLVASVTTSEKYSLGSGQKRIVAIDFGVKQTILGQLGEFFTVTVVPATTSSAEILSMEPDGIFLSNGPGDPSAVSYGIETIRQLLGKAPIFGICLGHQLLAEAIGAGTFKMEFGHHGGNHPVQRLSDQVVEITSQNHNYAVSVESLSKAQGKVEITHLNLNDGVVEGMRITDAGAFSVQYHPEAGPGPHDSRYLFSQFFDLVNGRAS